MVSLVNRRAPVRPADSFQKLDRPQFVSGACGSGRTNLYENLVIADIVKNALNRGIRPEIYFFRDSHGNEIDLLIREKGLLTPVEIKSAATFSTGFVKHLEWFQTLGVRRVQPGAVLYNGEQTFNVRGVGVLNPLHVEDIWQTLTVPSTGS